MTIEQLVKALEDGGKSDGRGLRITSYSADITGKAARLEIIEYLARLKDLMD
jgi:hypothetical protein